MISSSLPLSQCFSAGASIGKHVPDHPYQLIVSERLVSLFLSSSPPPSQDEGSFPLLTNDWGAIEEVLLLEAVEQDGFGNW